MLGESLAATVSQASAEIGYATSFALATSADPGSCREMNVLSELPRNRLLLALPSRDLRRLMSHLEHVPCRREQVLVEADSSLDHVFFPDSGVVSVMAVYSDGGTIEMATIGREGCAGVQAVFGTSKSSARIGFKFRGAQQRYLARHLHGPCGRCRPSEASYTLTSRRLPTRSCYREHATARTPSRSDWRAGC